MKKRLFIAIKLSQSTLNSLITFQKELKQQLPFKGIRWVDPGLFHLTLQFLGDTEVSQISTLTSNLESAAKRLNPFNITFEGSGFFGSNNSVRTIWAGTRHSPELFNLFNEVIQSTAFLNLDSRLRFSPHLTLARTSDWLTREESSRIASIVSLHETRVFGDTKVASFELIESILNPTGPIYKTVHIFDLV